MKKKQTEKITTEIEKVLEKVPTKATNSFISLLINKNSIFLAGAGRSKLVAEAFAMRLRQSGLNSYVVGDVVNPPITHKDLLVAVSGTGETQLTFDIVKEAKKNKAQIVVITARKNSKIAKAAQLVIELKAELDGTLEPLASLFEQSVFIYLDTVIIDMLKKEHRSFKELKKRHANL